MCSVFRSPFPPVGTCTDLQKNGDEVGTDCGGSCPPCYQTLTSGGYQGCYQDFGTAFDGQVADRICDDGGAGTVTSVQDVEDCKTRCITEQKQYMALGT